MNRIDSPAFRDEQWRGYDLRATIPWLVLAGLLTAGLLAGRVFFSDLPDAILTVILVLILWPALLFVGCYRAITYTYRVTDRALLVDRGFLHRPVPPIPYREIAVVDHGGNWIYSRLNIGWVRVRTTHGRSVRMPPLREPAAFAQLLRARAKPAG